MPKIMLHDAKAREALGRGVAKLAKAVSGTPRPARHERDHGPADRHPDRFARRHQHRGEIELEDPFENMGAQVVREVSKQTNDVAGDGTTTATVLANVLVQDGLEFLRQAPIPSNWPRA